MLLVLHLFFRAFTNFFCSGNYVLESSSNLIEKGREGGGRRRGRGGGEEGEGGGGSKLE